MRVTGLLRGLGAAMVQRMVMVRMVVMVVLVGCGCRLCNHHVARLAVVQRLARNTGARPGVTAGRLALAQRRLMVAVSVAVAVAVLVAMLMARGRQIARPVIV